MVKYGETDQYGTNAPSTELALDHKVVLTGLKSGTTYHFQITSADAAGNEASDQDRTFKTDPAVVTAMSTRHFNWWWLLWLLLVILLLVAAFLVARRKKDKTKKPKR